MRISLINKTIGSKEIGSKSYELKETEAKNNLYLPFPSCINTNKTKLFRKKF